MAKDIFFIFFVWALFHQGASDITAFNPLQLDTSSPEVGFGDGTLAMSVAYSGVQLFELDKYSMEWQESQLIASSNHRTFEIAGDVIFCEDFNSEYLDIYQKEFGSWRHVKALKLDISIDNRLVALSPQRLIVSIPYTSSLFILERNFQDNSWTRMDMQLNLPTDRRSLSTSHDRIAIGLENQVQLFQLTGGSWTFLKIITTEFSFSGEVLSLYDNFLAISTGSICDGQIEIFERNAAGFNSWSSVAVFGSPILNGYSLSDCIYFGNSLSIYQNTLLVGAPYWTEVDDSNTLKGGAFLYERNPFSQAWELVKPIRVTNPTSYIPYIPTDSFVGVTVSLSSNSFVLGSSTGVVFPFYFTPTNFKPNGSQSIEGQGSIQNKILVSLSCIFSICVLAFNLVGIKVPTNLCAPAQSTYPVAKQVA